MSTEIELQCLIIPMEVGNLLVPESLVAEIVLLEDSDTQQSIYWRNRRVPIYRGDTISKLVTRVAVLRAVMGYSDLPFVAIAIDGIPYTLPITPDSLTELPPVDDDCQIAASYTRVGSLDCMIPDLPKVEQMVMKDSVTVGG